MLLVAWAAVPLFALGAWLALRAPKPDRITVLSQNGSIAFVKRTRLAQDASAGQTVKTLVPVMEKCGEQTHDFTQCSTALQLKQYGGGEIPIGRGPEAGEVAVMATLPKTYTIAARSRTGGEFSISRAADGSLHRTCAPAGTDGCSAAGHW